MQISSEQAFKDAQKVIPGGVNSPVRAWGKVGGTPFFADNAQGVYLSDIDGNRYIDMVLAWGPLILGHSDPDVISAIEAVLKQGTAFGVPTIAETLLARDIVTAVDSVQKVRLVNSGTEATMSAIRLARAATGRSMIVKFEGNYHGHADYLLVKAGSGASTFGNPDSAGVPKAIAEDTLVLPYNNGEAVRALFAEKGRMIAGAIVEPVAGNMGVIPPEPGFLETLREETQKAGALLIIDEVMTGFRVAYKGAQSIYGIEPDITTLGKVIGGGLPVGAYGGRADLMDLIAPTGPMYQAGTLSGNPLSTAAGLASLKKLQKLQPYQAMAERTEHLCQGLQAAATSAGVTVTVNRVPAMFTVFFHPGPVKSFSDVQASDHQAFARFFHAMLKQGVNLPPSPYEATFLSVLHDEAIIDNLIRKAHQAFKEV